MKSLADNVLQTDGKCCFTILKQIIEQYLNKESIRLKINLSTDNDITITTTSVLTNYNNTNRLIVDLIINEQLMRCDYSV